MSAVYTRILTDAKNLASAVATGYTAVIRKEIKVFDGDTLPLLLIVPDMQAEHEEAFEGKINLKYKVGVALIIAGNQTFETGLSDLFDTRDDIRHALHITQMPTAIEVYDSMIDLAPVYDVSAIKANYDFTLMDFIYLSSENRNS